MNFLFALLAMLPNPANPQEAGLGELRFESFDSRRDGDSVVYIVSDLRFRKGDVRITGDYAVLWFDADEYDALFARKNEESPLYRKEMELPAPERKKGVEVKDMLGTPAGEKSREEYSLPPGLLREIYVEGSVYFSPSEKRIVQGSRMYMDFVTGRALLLNGTLHTTQAEFHGRPLSLSVKADLFRRESTGRFVAEEADYTTCSYAEPHMHIHSQQVWLEETAFGTAVDGYASTFHVEDQGILYIPRTTLDPESRDLIPFRGARIGTSSNFGFFLYTQWGQGFHTLGEDFNEWLLGERLPFKGEWGLRVDYRHNRGMAYGPELEWNSPNLYKGRLRTYFLQDQDQDSFFYPNKIDRNGDSRSLVQLENRIFLNSEWTLDTELYYQSDPGLRPEFLRSEFFREKEPESDVYLRWARENQAFTALVNSPLNSFEPVPVTGYPFGFSPLDPPALKSALPEASHRLYDEPLFELPLPGGTGEWSRLSLPLYYTEKSAAGYLKRQPARVDLQPSTFTFLPVEVQDSGRFDTIHELRAPFYAEPFILTPYIAERYSYYTQDADGGDASRLTQETGIRATTHFQGMIGENLLHFIDPSLSYENRFSVTRDASDLIQFDEADAVAKQEQIVLSLRNRFVDITPPPKTTKPVKNPGMPEWRPLFDLDLRMPVFLEPDRDNAGERLGKLETYLTFNSNIEWMPLRSLGAQVELFSKMDSFFQPSRLDLAHVRLTASPTDSLTYFVGHNRVRTDSGGVLLNSGVGGGIFYRVGEKWHILAADTYDFATNQSLNHTFTFRRLGHDWVIDFSIAFDDTTNEHSFTFNFQPRTLWDRGRPIQAVNSLLTSSLYGQDFYTNQ